MHETTSWRYRLQPKTGGIHTNSRQRNGFTKVENSIDGLKMSRVYKDSYRRIREVLYRCASAATWSNEQWATELDMSVSTWGMHKRVLRRAGKVGYKERRLFGCRQNLPSILWIVEGVPENRQERRKEKALKTTTPARENPRIESEARREQDWQDHQRMRLRFEAVGKKIEQERAAKLAAREENRRWWREGNRHRWDGGREHRLERARARTPMQGMCEREYVDIRTEAEKQADNAMFKAVQAEYDAEKKSVGWMGGRA